MTVWLSSGDRPRIIVDKLFSQSVADLAWAADGHTLLACSTDGRIAVLRASHPTSPTGQTCPANYLNFSLF